MKITAFYRTASVVKRLKALGRPTDVKNTYLGNTDLTVNKDSPELVVYEANNFTTLIPQLLQGLKPVYVTLKDVLVLEQNRHIKQGSKNPDGYGYWVSYGAEEFNVSTNATYGLAKGFRSIIEIHICGKSYTEVFDCYNVIREGDSEGCWKGDVNNVIVTASSDVDSVYQ